MKSSKELVSVQTEAQIVHDVSELMSIRFVVGVKTVT